MQFLITVYKNGDATLYEKCTCEHLARFLGWPLSVIKMLKLWHLFTAENPINMHHNVPENSFTKLIN